MEKVIELIKEFFKASDWKYKYNEKKKMFLFGVNMNGVLGRLRMCIFLRDESYIVYAILSNTPEEGCYGKVAEYLHRVNYGMRNGNFEFDYRDGEIRYKTYVNFEGSELSPDIITESILVPVFMVDLYGKNLMRIMLGDGDPAELVKEVESRDEDGKLPDGSSPVVSAQ